MNRAAWREVGRYALLGMALVFLIALTVAASIELAMADALMALIPAWIARRDGRDGVTWWAYGALIFPVALVHAVLTETPRPPRWKA